MRGKNLYSLTMAAVFSTVMFLGTEAFGAPFSSGSTGTDGAFAPVVDTELQLPPDGIFNFTTVNIPAGITVTFKHNAKNTPAYVLAAGDVTIEGTIDISGQKGQQPGEPIIRDGSGAPINNWAAKGGVGGFDGGLRGVPGTTVFPPILASAGLGPGGGLICEYTGDQNHGGEGGYAGEFVAVQICGPSKNWPKVLNGKLYGNEFLKPLVGGSGGAGGGPELRYGYMGAGGGGGGGAILIASSGTITVNGLIDAKGGISSETIYASTNGGTGSGGAVFLKGEVITGSGLISIWGGGYTRGYGSYGRVRLEANAFEGSLAVEPELVAVATGSPTPVFTAANPTIAVTNIGGTAVPGNLTGDYSTPDITLPDTTVNPVTLNIAATNIPVGTTVTVRVVPVIGALAEYTSDPLTGTEAASTTTASLELEAGLSVIIQVEANFTVTQLASNAFPAYAEGEKVVGVKVASVVGGPSTVTYITETGKEVVASAVN